MSASIKVVGDPGPAGAGLLSSAALEFILELDGHFDSRRKQLLEGRGSFRAQLERGEPPRFPEETRELRERAWTVVPPAHDLRDRRVEITGPPDRKMVINALNSGAKVYMADFEDAHSPTWPGTLDGQRNLYDAVRREISFRSPEGRQYRLGDHPAVLMVRPRGWHLVERHLVVADRPVSASLFDFGLFLFHNVDALRTRGTGPYFYLPKLEHFHEARLWNDVFVFAEHTLGFSPRTLRATVLIETLPAAFQMDEILWELREHSAGLNCGRWDYIFSYIKQFAWDRSLVFPDRAALPMSTPFLDAYSRLLVARCHARRAHAMGGMAAQIPVKEDPKLNEEALARVVADKEREVAVGHDGTWVAHPGLVPVALRVFNRAMPEPNQIDRPPETRTISPDDLLQRPSGPVTDEGLRRDARVALRYLEAWLRGVGCVPIDHIMEDAATVEIARAQVWQWVHHSARFDDGRPVDLEAYKAHLAREAHELRGEIPESSKRVAQAMDLLVEIVRESSCAEFLTQRAYAILAS